MKVTFNYNGFHGISTHTMIFPDNKTGDCVILTPAQLRKHRICQFHDCKCGEGIGFDDYENNNRVVKFIIPENGQTIKGRYPQSC
jgi:hypothetical protein